MTLQFLNAVVVSLFVGMRAYDFFERHIYCLASWSTKNEFERNGGKTT